MAKANFLGLRYFTTRVPGNSELCPAPRMHVHVTQITSQPGLSEL